MYQKPSVVVWLTPTEYDFETIKHKRPVSYNFEFKNVTDEPMLIDNVRSSCGCTAPEWTYDPILPDSTTTIKIEYDAKKIGYFYKKIKVFVSTQRKAEILYIEGEVVK